MNTKITMGWSGEDGLPKKHNLRPGDIIDVIPPGEIEAVPHIVVECDDYTITVRRWSWMEVVWRLVVAAVLIGLALAILHGREAKAGERPGQDHFVVLLRPALTPATLEDCDIVWRSRGAKPPRYAIVVNQTLCEPYYQCRYGRQAYWRACYRMEKPHAAAKD